MRRWNDGSLCLHTHTHMDVCVRVPAHACVHAWIIYWTIFLENVMYFYFLFFKKMKYIFLSQ